MAKGDHVLSKKKDGVVLILLVPLLLLCICFFLIKYHYAFTKIVCIDPGHQARPNFNLEPVGPGSFQTKEKVSGSAIGVLSSIPEYQITLAISLKLKYLLEKKGKKVIMTRETNDVDISNVERAKIANRANANLFVRIHADSFPDPNIKGISINYPGKNQWTKGIFIESRKAAQLVSDELLVTTGATKNRIKPRVDLSGFNWSRVPAILVEVGYLTNPSEDLLLNTDGYQWKVAQGICNGILGFLQD